jgi:hypothetical protein
MWDIRARGSVYKLATGNNVVVDMVWDSERNTLYAATKCKYVDRLGYHHGYRKARRDAKDHDGEERCWPQHAHHNEAYFGYMFDAGDQSLCER